MNMKKTMAAIAAGAVAVSAMATTVSAINDDMLVYKLVKEDTKYGTAWENGSATFQVKVNSTAVAAEEANTVYKWTSATANATTSAAAPADANATLTYTAIELPTGSGTYVWSTDGAAATTDTVAPAATNGATLTFTATVDAENSTEATPASNTYPDKVTFDVDKNGTLKNVIIKITSLGVAEQSNTYTYSTDTEALNYNPKVTTDGVIEFNGEFDNYTDPVLVTITAEFGDAWGTMSKKSDINTAIKTGDYGVEVANDCATTPLTLVDFKEGGGKDITVKTPFKTTLKASESEDVLTYLTTTMGYKNVKAVINDAIANHDSVVFKFNTASEAIGFVVDEGADTDWTKVYTPGWASWMSADEVAGSYEDALKLANGNASKLIAIYTTAPGATTEYTGFAQHLYPNYYDPEATTYTGFDWAGYNLFQGALIVNEGWTMSLTQSDYFDWNETSLSFSWDAIMDYAATENDYATFLHSMRLATSNTWYWDNLVIELANDADEDASSDAGVDGDGAELDDEVADDEIAADDTADEEPAPEVDEEPAPAPEVSNPTTGNASVALAVIPVALAAAAVVAKKRS